MSTTSEKPSEPSGIFVCSSPIAVIAIVPAISRCRIPAYSPLS